jgi:hypothetical protein
MTCDGRFRAAVYENGAPVSVGRITRTINRRLRRLIEHRDGGCAVPGCARRLGLEVHHIWHWEDGGPTDTWNLLTLCRGHHRAHHADALGITGNADLPRGRDGGVVFTDAWGRAIAPVGGPVVPPAGEPLAETVAEAGLPKAEYRTPWGEKVDTWGFHLQRWYRPGGGLWATPDGKRPHRSDSPSASARAGPNESHPADTADGPEADDDVGEIELVSAGARRPVNQAPPGSPASGIAPDPSRAGPAY